MTHIHEENPIQVISKSQEMFLPSLRKLSKEYFATFSFAVSYSLAYLVCMID